MSGKLPSSQKKQMRFEEKDNRVYDGLKFE